jgi:hypothetical protein
MKEPPAKMSRRAGSAGGSSAGRGNASKRVGDSSGASPPSKKPKASKLDNVVPAIKSEWDTLLKTLGDGKLSANALDKGITSWGKRKGALMAAQRFAELDDLQDMINEAKKVHRVLVTVDEISVRGPDLMTSYAHLDKYMQELSLDVFGCLPMSLNILTMKVRTPEIASMFVKLTAAERSLLFAQQGMTLV